MDREELERARTGDRGALDRILAFYRPLIYRYCRSRLGDYSSAEDVTQETCTALFVAITKGRAPFPGLAPYVFGIAANQVTSQLRSRYRGRELVTAAPPEVADDALSPEERALLSETSTSIAGLLAKLPARSQEILLLRIAARLSAEETAALLGTSAGAVRVSQHRALQQLRALAGQEVA